MCCPDPAISRAWSIRRRQANYQFWTNDNIKDVTLADWLKGAQEHKGSWWPDWRQWLASIDAEEMPSARAVGAAALAADRRCTRQLRPGPRIARRQMFAYNGPSRRDGTRNLD